MDKINEKFVIYREPEYRIFGVSIKNETHSKKLKFIGIISVIFGIIGILGFIMLISYNY